ncbi:MAG: antibiotic biosynthesis monooxygenase [Pseudonocardiales bacterium]|nr:antibiotic biosynthesis monooxygenase [Pseudonocardiales bacterium]
MASHVRVLVFARAPAADPDAVERAYHEISRMLQGTAGLLGNELLRSAGSPDEFAVMSKWEDMAAFRAWEQGQDHRTTTSPLRPYQDGNGGRSFDVYEVVARYLASKPSRGEERDYLHR